MNEESYKFIKKKREEGELIPFSLLKAYLEYEISQNKSSTNLNELYRIEDTILFNKLTKITNYDEYLSIFLDIKYSLSKRHLDIASKKLNQDDLSTQKEFIDNIPNSMFLNIYNILKGIMASGGEQSKKRANIIDSINHFYTLYYPINEVIIFPTLIASLNYCYNKLILDFIDCLKRFLQKRNNEPNDEDSKVNNYDNKNNEVQNNKNKFKTINTNEYIEYSDDKEFIDMFEDVLEFIGEFRNVLEKISMNENDKENITRLNIIIFYLNHYEEVRQNYDDVIIAEIAKSLMSSIVNESILDKFIIYDKNKRKINKSSWEQIGINDVVDITINNEIISNIKIKYFNLSILDLEPHDLKKALINYKTKYLSIYGIKMKSLLFKSFEIENIVKENIFNLISSDIVKQGFQELEPRFDHTKIIYPFQGYYKKEIFEEIWNNILVVPFIYKTICARTERTDYKIYLDLNPNDAITSSDAMNIISSKKNDIFHEIFHIIAILYAANDLKYSNIDFSTISYSDKIDLNKINNIFDNYKDKYPKEMVIIPDKKDMGDIMELYLYGIKPGETYLYPSLYLSYILNNKEINNINVEILRENYINLIKSNLKFDSKENNNNYTKDAEAILKYFKDSKIWEICIKYFSSPNIIYNSSHRRRSYNGNEMITNSSYRSYRRPCFPRRDKKINIPKTKNN